jgi:radical SAM superfamily enzyme YgiQ (UPF0313 family)
VLKIIKGGLTMKVKLIMPVTEELLPVPGSVWYPRLGIGIVAALTPPGIEVSIEHISSADQIDAEKDIDLVGLTALTCYVPLAYEISDKYRKMGVTTVLGGVHPTVLPGEAIQHADAVVIGEAENVWNDVLRDFSKGTLKKFYRSERFAEMKNIPFARIDLMPEKSGFTMPSPIHTTRGCTFDCYFCIVTQMFGHVYRFRPVNQVVEEVKKITEEGHRLIVFNDDNIVCNPKYSKELFRALEPMEIIWGGHASLRMAKDKELLELCKKSGGMRLYVGIESLSQENLSLLGVKSQRVEDYEYSIEKIQDYGIEVTGAFIIGLDHDDETVFERILEFLWKVKMRYPQLNILTPYPGTKIYKQLEAEKRIFERDWSKYDQQHVVFKPRRISVEGLEEGVAWLRKEVEKIH